MGPTPFFYQELDPTYWMFMILGVSEWLQSPAIIILDVCLFVLAVAGFTWPGKPVVAALFTLVYFIWFVLFNGSMGHHYAFLGILFVSLPFAFSNTGFSYLLLFIRFVFCFIYGTAGLWKLFRGNLFYSEQTRSALISLNLQELSNPDGSFRTQLLQWLIAHPVPAHSLWVVMMLLELAFLIGFITLRYDKVLLICYLLFAIGGWYFFDVWNYENLLFLITLYPLLQAVAKLSQKHPKVGP